MTTMRPEARAFPATTGRLSEFRTTTVPPSRRTTSSKRTVTSAGAVGTTAPSEGDVETTRAWAEASEAAAAERSESAAATASVRVHRIKVSTRAFGLAPPTVRRQCILPAPTLRAMSEVQDVSRESGQLEWETPLFNQ